MERESKLRYRICRQLRLENQTPLYPSHARAALISSHRIHVRCGQTYKAGLNVMNTLRETFCVQESSSSVGVQINLLIEPSSWMS